MFRVTNWQQYEITSLPAEEVFLEISPISFLDLVPDIFCLMVRIFRLMLVLLYV